MRRRDIIVAAGALVAMLEGRAVAQTPSRGDRAIFGGGVGSAEQVLAVRSTVGATFNDPIGRVTPGQFRGRVVDRTWFGQASSQLTYRYTRPSLNISAAGGGFSYYQPRADQSWTTQYTADAAVATGHTFVLSPRSSFSLRQAMTFRPTYLGTTDPGVFTPGDGAPNDSLYLPPEIVSIRGRELRSSSNATFRYDVSQRVTVDSGYGFERTWVFDTEDEFDRLLNRADAGLQIGLTRRLRLITRYRFSHYRALTPDDTSYRESIVDVGINYDRGGTIRLSRRTTLTFDGGVSGFADSRGDQRYFLLGNVLLGHELGRTWRASAGYRRNLDFISLFREPVLSDTASAGLSGLITRSLSFRAGASYSAGTVGFGDDGNQLTRTAALTALELAINRYLALGVNYTYYRYVVGSSVVVRPEFEGGIEGQAVRFYLSTWAPIVARIRRPDATR